MHKNIILADELSTILSAFNRQGIEAVPLKGTVLAELLYGNPGLRTITDIDLLVRPEALSRASTILLKMGYQQATEERLRVHSFHGAPYCKEGKFPQFLELHWNLDDEKLVSIPLQEIWRRVRALKLPWGSIKVLSPEDTLLYASLQFSKDISKIKILSDVAEILKKYAGVLDWEYVIASAHTWQIEIAVYLSLRQAREILGAPVPTSMERLKPGLLRRWLLNFMATQAVLTSPIKNPKLRKETAILARCLMLKRFRRMLKILSDYRGRGIGAWFRTILWILLVTGASLGRKVTCPKRSF